MSHGPGRRRRSSDPSPGVPGDDDWLAGYRPSPDDQDVFGRVQPPADPDAPASRQGPTREAPPEKAPTGREAAAGRDLPAGGGVSPARGTPLPGEEPIFRPIDPLPPGQPPPAPQEEPILRYMQPQDRSAGTARRWSYARRRIAPPRALAPPTVALPSAADDPTQPAEQAASVFGRAARSRSAEERRFRSRSGPTVRTPLSAPAADAPGPGGGLGETTRRGRGESASEPVEAVAAPGFDPNPAFERSTPRRRHRREDDTEGSATAAGGPTTAAGGHATAAGGHATAAGRHATAVGGPATGIAGPAGGGDRPDSPPGPRRYPGTGQPPQAYAPRPDRTPPPTRGPGAAVAQPPGQVPTTPAQGPVWPRRPEDPGGPPRMGPTTSGPMRPVRRDTTGGVPRTGPPTSGSMRPVRVDPVKPMNKPRSRWVAALSTVAVLVLLAVCGLGTYFLVKDERNGPEQARRTDASASPSLQRRDISTRDVDAALLTEAEVFPRPQVAAAPNEAPYQVLKTQASDDCRTAATDQLGTLLVNLGCNQVVRGTIKTPDNNYLVTAGIFNLRDEPAAIQAHENIKPTIDAQKGRLTGLLAGPGTEILVRSPMILGWHARGHYLAYCIIARADGKAFDANDPFPNKIQADILTTHLRDNVIGARAVVQPSTTPS